MPPSTPASERKLAAPTQSSIFRANGAGKKIPSTPPATTTAPSTPPSERCLADSSQSSTPRTHGAGKKVPLTARPPPEPVQQRFFLGPAPHQVRKVPVELVRRFTTLLSGRPLHLDHALPPIRLPHTTAQEFIAIESYLYACALSRHNKSYALNLAALCFEIAEEPKDMAVSVAVARDILKRGRGPLVMSGKIHWGQHWHNMDRAYNVMGPDVKNALVAHVGEHYGIYRKAWEEDREKREKRERGGTPKEGGAFRECFEGRGWWWSAGFEGKRIAKWAVMPSAVEEVLADEEMARWEQQLKRWEELEDMKSSAAKTHLAGQKK